MRIALIVFIFFISSIEILSAYNLDTLSEKKYNNWDFRISPFFWYMGVEGQINVPPDPSILPEFWPNIDIDVSFKEISNSIKFAIMMSGDFRGDWLVSKFNFTSLIMETNAVRTNNALLENVNVKLYYFSGDAALGYLFMNKKKVDMEGFIGLKVASVKVNVFGDVLTLPYQAERHTIWFDPMIAYRIRYFPVKKLELMGYVDTGLLFWDHFAYQINSEAIFHFSKLFYMSLGYRVWSLDSQVEDVAFAGRIKGWITRIGFQF